MNCFELMIEEHRNIKRMLVIIRKICSRILIGNSVRYEDFFKIIDFIRDYTDKHHHGKEESLLFVKMVEKLGAPAEKLIKYGMNVEHDLGRFYTHELELAVKRVLDGDMDSRLDVIANAISYAHLLNRHIDKEDGVVYQFAQKNLPQETLTELEQECSAFEQSPAEINRRETYLKMLQEFESLVSR